MESKVGRKRLSLRDRLAAAKEGGIDLFVPEEAPATAQEVEQQLTAELQSDAAAEKDRSLARASNSHGGYLPPQRDAPHGMDMPDIAEGMEAETLQGPYYTPPSGASGRALDAPAYVAVQHGPAGVVRAVVRAELDKLDAALSRCTIYEINTLSAQRRAVEGIMSDILAALEVP